MKLRIGVITARLRAPFSSAWGSILDRPLVLVRLEDTDGHVGLGEAAPLPDYHGVNVEDVVEALEAARVSLAGPPSAASARDRLAEWGGMAVLPALAAIDMAGITLR